MTAAKADIALSEDDIALDFTKRNPTYCWVEGWRQWMTWTGRVWERDCTLRVFDAVRAHVRSTSWVVDNTRALLKAATIAAVERLARSDRAYAATVDQWDADPWLLNTPGGIIDLSTGIVGEHTPAAYCTMMTTVAPLPTDCPRWRSFLADVTKEDAELMAFLQRVLGYTLTGRTTDHALFFAHGGGGNGKSTFLDTITGILGNYAVSAPMEVFVASHSDRHPTELAMLRGARLVTAVETDEGRRWAESRIKALTGGDQITARFMRENFFTFIPTFKLIVIGNHKPRLHAVDEAMRRRLHLIPFEATFTGNRLIKDMPALLREEAPGILHWMIEGCLQWQRCGLSPPERVRAATAAYFENQDIMAEWRSECCETGPGFWESPRGLFASWRDYAKAAEYPIGQMSSFVDRLEAAGFRQYKDRKKGRHWVGIRVKQEAEQINRDCRGKEG